MSGLQQSRGLSVKVEGGARRSEWYVVWSGDFGKLRVKCLLRAPYHIFKLSPSNDLPCRGITQPHCADVAPPCWHWRLLFWLFSRPAHTPGACVALPTLLTFLTLIHLATTTEVVKKPSRWFVAAGSVDISFWCGRMLTLKIVLDF